MNNTIDKNPNKNSPTVPTIFDKPDKFNGFSGIYLGKTLTKLFCLCNGLPSRYEINSKIFGITMPIIFPIKSMVFIIIKKKY